MVDLLIRNIGVLATPLGNAALHGREQSVIRVIKNAAVGITGGSFTYVGPDGAAAMPEGIKEIDAQGRLATPGLVDCHTHLVFGGWRQHEMAQKLAGVSYLDILRGGGGILNTVEATRKAGEDELFEKGKQFLNEMAAHGTTACEIKSGYGLDFETELKQLRVIKELKEKSHTDIAATYMGAHAVPSEFKDDRHAYIKLIIEEVMPAVKKENLAEFCDVFCETAAFNTAESEEILLAAKSFGLVPKIHADEIDSTGGAELAAKVSAVSAEHLIEASDAGIKAMSANGVIAVLLPATSFYLDKPYAKARKMIESGMAIAVATDFNPGSSPNLNLQFCMNLACLKYKLNPEEALTAVTLNAAAAVGMSLKLGTTEAGKQGDLLLWNAEDLNMIFYRYGTNQINTVIKKGVPVYVNPNENK